MLASRSLRPGEPDGGVVNSPVSSSRTTGCTERVDLADGRRRRDGSEEGERGLFGEDERMGDGCSELGDPDRSTTTDMKKPVLTGK